MADGDYEGPIGPLNEKIKAEFEARPDRAELEAKYNMEYGDRSISPEDLAKPRTHEEYVASLDRALANHAALEAERKAKGQEAPAPAGSGESAPMELTPEEIAVTEALRQELGDGYEAFEADGRQGLQSLLQSLGVTTREQAEKALVGSGILKNSAALKDMMNALAKHGKTLRR